MCTNIKKHGWIIKEIEMNSLAEAKATLGELLSWKNISVETEENSGLQKDHLQEWQKSLSELRKKWQNFAKATVGIYNHR